jgi:hypothetical protein
VPAEDGAPESSAALREHFQSAIGHLLERGEGRPRAVLRPSLFLSFSNTYRQSDRPRPFGYGRSIPVALCCLRPATGVSRYPSLSPAVMHYLRIRESRAMLRLLLQATESLT